MNYPPISHGNIFFYKPILMKIPHVSVLCPLKLKINKIIGKAFDTIAEKDAEIPIQTLSSSRFNEI